MLSNLIDKLFFGSLLLGFFQLPLLSNDFLQHLNGYYLATKVQVEQFRQNAKMHGYQDVYAMIEDFKTNSNPAVRKDAEQKALTMSEYLSVSQGIEIMQNGHLLQKLWYMFSPERWHFLTEVARHFKPGIPLTIADVVYSVIAALFLSGVIMWPFKRSEKRNLYG